MERYLSRTGVRVTLAACALLALTLLAACDSDDEDADPTGNPATSDAGTLSDDDGTPVAEPDDATGDDADDGEPSGPAHAVVSAHELATQAGIDVLEQGGTAADAAIAVAAALSVVEPWFSSALGGGTWALYYDAESGEITSLDGVGPTGSHATVEDFAERAGDSGMHQSNTPGAWDGWMLWLREYGRLDLGDVLAPAITAARDGYEVYPGMARRLRSAATDIDDLPDTLAIYAPDGEILEEGDIVHQHDMADTFEALVDAYDSRLEDGRDVAVQAARDYYYRGPIADAIVAASDELGGYLAIENFHTFEAAIVEPISIQYNDEVTVYQNPPNSQGITQLIALNILKHDDFSALDPDHPDALHLMAESLKLAFEDRHLHVGDPTRVDVPVADLLSDEHARQQRERIDMGSALEWPFSDELAAATPSLDVEFEDPPYEMGTTTYHVVDAKGNAAAVTTSLGSQFFVIGDTGIHINNRMRFLATEDGDPNQLEAGYQVRHTSNPFMAVRDGRPFILGGNTGVDTQSQGQLQQFLHVVEFGLTAQEAVDRPRLVTTAFPATTYPYTYDNVLEVLEGFSEETLTELEARGHDITETSRAGSANMIVVRPDGSIETGAEPSSGIAEGIIIPASD